MSQINLAPLDDAIAWAQREYDEAHVDGEPTWNQKFWLVQNECGTTACIAGRIVLAAGYVPDEVERHTGDVYRVRHPETGDAGDPRDVAFRIVLGDHADDPKSGPCEVMDRLTSASNSLDDIRKYRDSLARLAESGW